MDANSAQQIISDPRTDKNSPAYKTAVSFLAGQRQQKASQKQDELDAQRAMENGDLGTAAKNVVAGNLAQIKDLASFRGDQKARLYNMITDAATAAGKDPKDYSPAKLEAKAKVLNDFADGKAAGYHGVQYLPATWVGGFRCYGGDACPSGQPPYKSPVELDSQECGERCEFLLLPSRSGSRTQRVHEFSQ